MTHWQAMDCATGDRRQAQVGPRPVGEPPQPAPRPGEGRPHDEEGTIVERPVRLGEEAVRAVDDDVKAPLAVPEPEALGALLQTGRAASWLPAAAEACGHFLVKLSWKDWSGLELALAQLTTELLYLS